MGNTGTPNCKTLAKTTSMLFAVPLIADDGTPNTVDVNATLNQAFFDALTQHADASKRWYPIKGLENVSQERADAITQSYESGKIIKIQDGQKTFKAIIPQQDYTYLGKVEKFGCMDFGVYIVDIEGNLKGEISADKLSLNPMKIARGTWNVRYSEATDTKVNEVLLDFQFAKTVRDSSLRMIVPSEMANIDLTDMEGLMDVNGAFTNPLATSVTAKLTLDYGTAVTPIPVEGLLLADFTVRNVSTSTAYAVSAATETTGTYALTFATAPAGTYRIEVPAAKGYEPIVIGTFVIV